MSTSAISSTQYSLMLSWQAMVGAAPAAGSGGSTGSASASCSTPAGDSATFSPQALAQLQADQGTGAGAPGTAPQLTDSQAAAVGAIIQQNDPSLFQQLDSSGTSQLSASDLENGVANLIQQLQAQSGGSGAAPATAPAAAGSSGSAPAGSSTATPAASLQTIGQAIAKALTGGKGHGHHHGHHGGAAPAAAATAPAPTTTTDPSSTTSTSSVLPTSA